MEITPELFEALLPELLKAITPEVLSRLPECDIMSMGAATQEVMKRKELKAKHVTTDKDGKVTQIPIFFNKSDGPKGRWETKVPDGDGNLKKKKFTYERDLWLYLENLYKEKTVNTVEEIYNEWIENLRNISPANASKQQWVWRTYYEGTPFVKRDARELTVQDHKNFLQMCCKKFHLTIRKLREVKTLDNQLFDYAFEQHYVDDKTPRRIYRMDTWSCLAIEEQKPDEKERFDVAEAVQICQTAVRLFHEHDDVLYLAIPLSFQIGLRAGEMVCLKWKDIEGDTLTLQRQEVKQYYTDETGTHKQGYKVVPWLKKHKVSRTIQLTQSAHNVLNLIKDFNASHGLRTDPEAFIFLRLSGVQHHTTDLHTLQNRACKAAGLQHRSFHKIRKTWVSSLLTIKSIPITNVKEMAGHESAEMTLNVYGKTITPDSKIRAEMEKALPAFNPAETKIS